MREEVEEVGMKTNLDPDLPTPPSMENSIHQTQDEGSQSSVHATTESIAKCILRRIDPSLRQGKLGHDVEVDRTCQEDLCDGN